MSVGRPGGPRRLVPRFSLRTLVVFMLLATSGTGLWWHWSPWYLSTVLPGSPVMALLDSAVFSPRGEKACLLHGGGYSVLDLANGNCSGLGTRGRALSAGFTPDGSLLVVGSQNYAGELRTDILEVASIPGISRHREMDGFGGELSLLPGGEAMLGFTADGAEIRSLRPGGRAVTLRGSGPWVSSLAASPDGSEVAGHGAGVLQFWDARSGAQLRQFHCASVPMGASVCYLPRGEQIAVLCLDNPLRRDVLSLKILDAATGEPAAGFRLGGGARLLEAARSGPGDPTDGSSGGMGRAAAGGRRDAHRPVVVDAGRRS